MLTYLQMCSVAFAWELFLEAWWRHQMKTFSALLAICAGNSPDPGEFPTQRPVTRSFDVYFDLRPNKRLSKHSWGWWFETLSCSLWRHRNGLLIQFYCDMCLEITGLKLQAHLPGAYELILCNCCSGAITWHHQSNFQNFGLILFRSCTALHIHNTIQIL